MTQYDILEFLQKNKGWFNTEEIRVAACPTISNRSMVNKMRKLVMFGFIERRESLRAKGLYPKGRPFIYEYKIK